MLSNENRFSGLRIFHAPRLAFDYVKTAYPGYREPVISRFTVCNMRERIQYKPGLFLGDSCTEGQFADQRGLIIRSFFHCECSKVWLQSPVTNACIVPN